MQRQKLQSSTVARERSGSGRIHGYRARRSGILIVSSAFPKSQQQFRVLISEKQNGSGHDYERGILHEYFGRRVSW